MAEHDYWWYAGEGVINLGPNPLNPAELLSEGELDRIHQGIQQAFMERLAGARAGTVAASEEAQSVIDSLLPMVDEPTRRQLGVVCDYLGGKTKTAPRDAALFVGKQVHVWAKGPEYGMGTPQKAAEWAVGQAEHGLLLGTYQHVVETLASHWIQTWQPLHDAKDGKITWDEARRRVDEHIKAHPDDPDVQKDGPTVRDVILPQWRAKYEQPWWKRWLDRLRGEGTSEAKAPPDDERYTYSFHGYWKYHDHAVTRYDGLAPETTDEPLRRAVGWIDFTSEMGYQLLGPFVLDQAGFFQSGTADVPDLNLLVRPFVRLRAQFPGYQWPQIYVMEAAGVNEYRIESAMQTAYPGNADLGSCFPNPAHPVRDEALNIFDRLVEAWQRIPTTPPPQSVTLFAIWKAGQRRTTGYDGVTNRIYLNGAGNCPEEWNDDTIVHESGHFVFDAYGTDVTPGGGHFWWQSDSTSPALALSEGWADLYQCYVNHQLGVPGWHEGYSLIALGGLGGTETDWCEIENPWHFGVGGTPSPGSSLQHGLYNEASVAGCLWDMFDTANETYETACSEHPACYADDLASPIMDIWNAVMTGVPVTLLGVLETWYANGYGHQAEVCEICNHHGIARWLWVEEPNDRIARSVTTGVAETTPVILRNTDGTAPHSYTVSTDVAWAWFDVGSGSIPPDDSVDLQLWLDGVGWPLGEVRQGLLTVSDGSGGCGLQVALQVTATDEGMGSIVARVADANGWLEGATAGTDPAGATAATGEDGWFMLTVAEGAYTLRVWAAGYYPVMIPDVTCPSDVGTIVLTPHGTPEGSAFVCMFHGSTSTFQGRALLAGDVVEAWDPDGVLCGGWEVTTEGGYGPMTVYGDDVATPGVDEGADEGDTLRFTINGFTAQCLGPDEPIWHAGGGPCQVELTAHDAPPKPVTDLAVAPLSGLALLQWTAVSEDTSGNPEPSIRTFIQRSPGAYFDPGDDTEIDWVFGDTEYWDWESGVGDPNEHSFYRIVIRDNLGQESVPSNTVGEFEFG
ncbi:MAG: carboxypeptidase-like regulatory domain-containing protein, partial [Candidatus Eisenbacteria bacterium]|nr:carboxypeptidase-like regulatory domain-containing protein [Candidatus Eisenbacteria bacterium]